MKRTLAFTLAFLLGIGNFTATFADSAQDALTRIIEKTVKNDYIQARVDESIQYGDKNTMQLTTQMSDAPSAQKTKMQMKMNLDSSAFKDFKDTITQGDKSLEDAFNTQVKVNTGFEYFYDKQSKDAFATMLPFTAKITSSSADIKSILEGFLEFPKLFTSKTFRINIEQIAKEMGDKNLSDPETIKALTQSVSKEDIAQIYIALIKSGIFTVDSVKDNTYTLGLIKDVKNLDLKAIKDAVQALSFIPDAEKAMLFDSIPAINTEDIQNANDMLKIVNSVISTDMTVSTDGSTVTAFQLNIKIAGAALAQKLSLPQPLADITMKETGTISYNQTSPENKYEEAETIHINKIVSAFQTIAKQSQARMEEYTKNNHTLEVVEPKYEKLSDEEILVSIPQDAWYREHAQYLVKNSVLTTPINPNEKITEQTLYDLVSASGSFGEYPSLSENIVSKTEMIRYIVQSVNEDALYRESVSPTYSSYTDIKQEKQKGAIEFAKKHGMISASFDEAQAKITPASNSETIKVLALALKEKEKYDRAQALKQRHQ